jgi:hypothetical protein
MLRYFAGKENFGAVLLFLSWLVLGYTLIGDYGMSYDETYQRNLGLANARYVREFFGGDGSAITDRRLLSPDQGNRYHGAVFTLLAYELERLTGARTFVEQFRLRHALSFGLYWLAGLALFFAGRRILRGWWTLLPPLFLLLYPRIFAHAFFNPKDIPLLAFYTFGLCSLLGFIHRRTWGWTVVHALFCGIAMAQRPSALILPVATAAILIYEWIRDGRSFRRGHNAMLFALYLFAFGVATTVFWPVLWSDPPGQFAAAWHTMRTFSWEGHMLFQGRWIKSTDLPWYYLPVWIGVSTPPLYLAGMLAAMVLVPAQAISRLRGRQLVPPPAAAIRQESLLLGVWLAATGPLLAVVVLDPVLYDGWRHFYFVAPSWLLLAAWSCWWSYDKLRSRGALRLLVPVLLGVQILSVGWHLIALHPYQQTYFNSLAGRQQFGRYELDYWGPAFRQAWQRVGERFPGDTLRVNGNDGIAHRNLMYLYDTDLRGRLHYVDQRTKADIYVTNHRDWHDWRPAFREKRPPFNGTLIDSIVVDGNRLIGIYLPGDE